MSLKITVCVACSHAVFPPRALCPRCASAEWTIADAQTGRIEQITTRDGVVVAAVKADLGPVIIVRANAEMRRGDTVFLSLEHGAPQAVRAE